MKFKDIAKGVFPYKEDINILDWADRYIYIPKNGTRIKFDSNNMPFIKQILIDASPQSKVREIYIEKSSQIGMSTSMAIIQAYYSIINPSNQLYLTVSETLASYYLNSYYKSLLISSDFGHIIQETISSTANKSTGDNKKVKKYSGGEIRADTAGSESSIRGYSANIIILDEYAATKDDLKNNGDPLTAARSRTLSYGSDYKIIVLSTPKIEDTCKMDRLYKTGSKGKFLVPCEKCNVEDELNDVNLTEEGYVCPHCKHVHKTKKNHTKGKWVMEDEKSIKKSYRVNALYSPTEMFSYELYYEKLIEEKTFLEQMAFDQTIRGKPAPAFYTQEINIDQIMELYENDNKLPILKLPDDIQVYSIVLGVDLHGEKVKIDDDVKEYQPRIYVSVLAYTDKGIYLVYSNVLKGSLSNKNNKPEFYREAVKSLAALIKNKPITNSTHRFYINEVVLDGAYKPDQVEDMILLLKLNTLNFEDEEIHFIEKEIHIKDNNLVKFQPNIWGIHGKEGNKMVNGYMCNRRLTGRIISVYIDRQRAYVCSRRVKEEFNRNSYIYYNDFFEYSFARELFNPRFETVGKSMRLTTKKETGPDHLFDTVVYCEVGMDMVRLDILRKIDQRKLKKSARMEEGYLKSLMLEYYRLNYTKKIDK